MRLGIEIAAWRSTSRDLPYAPSAEMTEALRGVFFDAALGRVAYSRWPPRASIMQLWDPRRRAKRCGRHPPTDAVPRRVACSDSAAVGVHPGQTSGPTLLSEARGN